MLGDRLRNIFDSFKNKRFISKDDFEKFIKELQKALILADVDVEIVFEISKKLKDVLKEKLPENFSEKEYFIKKAYEIIADYFGNAEKELNARKIMLIGLYGSGKTTTAAKLANYFSKKSKKVSIATVDVHRPAAFKQLKSLVDKLPVQVIEQQGIENTISNLLFALKNSDIAILDTAGRASLDEELKEELLKIKKMYQPDFVFLVLPADIGQIAKKEIEAFLSVIDINGIIISKTDSSAKGGAAIFASKKSKAPIYFIGTGEKIDDFTEFDSHRYLSRIMGYGDIKELIERIPADAISFDEKFDFFAFKKQIKAMKKIGSFSKIASLMGFPKVDAKAFDIADEKVKVFGYIIDSMTNYERKNPEIINASRIRRISKGSGRSEREVRELLKQYKLMKSFMDKKEDFDKNNIMDIFSKNKAIKKLYRKKMKFKIR